MTHIVHPILLAGGSGTRLWPLSRKSYPKQFAKLIGEESLFQASAQRLSGDGFAAPMILTGSDFRFIVTEQLAAVEIAPAAILIEPEGRNTAAAILAAALSLAARAPHPGAALSLQSHHHRSEHWIVVEGTARVTVGDEVKLVTENQSVYIPLGATHRMENPGKVPMVLIEVQTGSYLGEDDIIRYEDVYARGQGRRDKHLIPPLRLTFKDKLKRAVVSPAPGREYTC